MDLVTRTALAVGMVSTLMLGVLGTGGYFVVRERTLEAEQLKAELRAQGVAAHVEARLQQALQSVDTLSRNVVIRNALLDGAGREIYVKPILNGMAQIDGHPVSLSLVDFQGKEVIEVGTETSAAPDRHAWLRERLAGGTPGVRGVDRDGKLHLLTIAYPVVLPNTRSVEGVMAIRVSVTTLLAGLGAEGDSYKLASLAGPTVQTRNNAARDGAGVALRLPPPLDQLGLTLQAHLDRSDAERALGLLQVQYLAAGLVSVIAMVGLIIFAARRVAEPIRLMTAEAQRMSERLALAVKGTRDGIWDWDVRTDAVYFSPRWKEILGFGEDELPNTAAAFFERLHPDDRDAVGEAVRRHFEFGEPYAVETRLRHKNGSYRWVHTRGTAVRDAQGQIERMVGSIADISERKHVEESLRAGEERYRQIVETAREGIWVIDANNVTTLANARMGEILGWKAEELIGTSMFDHMDEQGRAVAAANVERRRQGITEEHEFPFLRKDGSAAWCLLGTSPLLDAEGRYAGALAMVTDITERRRTEQALMLSETRLRQAVRATRSGIFDHDHRTDIIYWSPEQRANYGFSADEPVTLQGFLACVHPDDLASIGSVVARAHDPMGDGLFDVEHRIIRRDGQVRWLATRSLTLFEGEGAARRPLRTVGAVVDITERKRAEEQIRVALGDKEVLLKEIYHRVKNNLQVIASLLNLQGRNRRDAKTRALLEESANRVKSMALVHEQLYQGGDLSSIDFASYLGQLVRHLADAHGELAQRVPIRLDVAPVQLGIETAVPLGLIINELLSNAYKHAYPGERGGEVVLQLTVLDDGRIEVVVRDRGVGLPPGFQLESVASLGMRLVASLTEQLEGALEWGLNGDAGSRFAIRFRPAMSELKRLAA